MKKSQDQWYPLFHLPQVRGSQGQTQKGQAGQRERIAKCHLAHSRRKGPLWMKTSAWDTRGSSLLQRGSLGSPTWLESKSRLQVEKQYFIYFAMFSCVKCLLRCVPIHCLSLKPTSCWSSSQLAAKEKMKPANSCFWVQSLYLRGQVGLRATIWTAKKQQIPAINLLLYHGALQRQKEGSCARCSRGDGGHCKWSLARKRANGWATVCGNKVENDCRAGSDLPKGVRWSPEGALDSQMMLQG